MTYRTEFPDFDYEVPALLLNEDAWEDTSWKNDACPSFTCDVFVLWVDYADPAQRDFPGMAQFTMTDEGREVLSTDNWEDVRAFIEDGRRDFPEYKPQPWYPREAVEYQNGVMAKVAHVESAFAVLEHDDGSGFVLAEGDRHEFSFPREGEADEKVATLEAAKAQLAAAKAEA